MQKNKTKSKQRVKLEELGVFLVGLLILGLVMLGFYGLGSKNGQSSGRASERAAIQKSIDHYFIRMGWAEYELNKATGEIDLSYVDAPSDVRRTLDCLGFYTGSRLIITSSGPWVTSDGGEIWVLRGSEGE